MHRCRCPPVGAILRALPAQASGIPTRGTPMLLTLLAIVWVLIWALAFVDILRRKDLRTSSKVLWALAVFFVPVIGVLVYLVARPAEATQYAPADRLQDDASYERARDRHPV